MIKREPHVVPDRQHGEHGDGRQRRPQQRHDDAPVDRPLVGAVDARRLEHVVGHLVDEAGEDEHGDGQAHRHVHRDQAPVAVDQADALDHAHDVDGRQPDRDHQPGDEHEVDHRRRPAAPLGQRQPGHRADQQDDGDRDPGDDRGCCGTAWGSRPARSPCGTRRACPRWGQRAGDSKISCCGLNELISRIQTGPSTTNDHRVRIRYVRRAGLLIGWAFRSPRAEYSQIDAPAARMRNVTVAMAAPRPALGWPVGGSPEMPVR